MAFDLNNCQTLFRYCSHVTLRLMRALRFGVASVIVKGCNEIEGSFTNSNEMGTITVDNKAKAPMTQEKDNPLLNEPLYSLEFMPSPTKATAKIFPMVRTRYTDVCVCPLLHSSSFLASWTVNPSAATSETQYPKLATIIAKANGPPANGACALHGSAATFTPSCLCLAVVMYRPD